jgi:hypothetical protein
MLGIKQDKLLWLLKNKKKNNIVNTYKMWGAGQNRQGSQRR